MKKIKNLLKSLILTWGGRYIIGVVLALAGLLVKDYNFWFLVMVTGLAIIGIQIFIFFIYAWVINPIREWRKWKKIKD